MSGPVSIKERAIPMSGDSGWHPAATIRCGYIDRLAVTLDKAPKIGRRAMRKKRTRPARQDCGHIPSFPAYGRMPDGVDALVHPMKPAASNALLRSSNGYPDLL